MTRALIIDDNRIARLLIRRAMQEFDLEFIEATDGASGVEVSRTNKPDIIFLDYNMPGQSGLDTLAQLKNTDETRSIPVVMLTGETQKTVMQRALDLGSAGYLQKPFNPDHVRELLATLFPDRSTVR